MKRETAQKLFALSFKTCELLLPTLAKRWGRKLFFTPFRHKRPAREMKAWREAWKQELPIEIDVAQRRYRTHYRFYRWGKDGGPRVLLIHGWSGRATQLSVIAEELVKAGFEVLAFDGLAHGDSPGKHTNLLEFNAIVQDINRRFGPLDAIVGHSFGGVVGALSHNHSVALNALVTIGTPVTMDYLLDEFTRIIGAGRKTRAAILEYTESRIDVELDAFSPQRLLKDSDLPGLIIHDREDKESDYRQAPQLNEAWRGAELKLTSGLGHQRILRDPSTARMIAEFLEKELVHSGEKAT